MDTPLDSGSVSFVQGFYVIEDGLLDCVVIGLSLRDAKRGQSYNDKQGGEQFHDCSPAEMWVWRYFLFGSA
jgi:hypothetical protein